MVFLLCDFKQGKSQCKLDRQNNLTKVVQADAGDVHKAHFTKRLTVEMASLDLHTFLANLSYSVSR